MQIVKANPFNRTGMLALMFSRCGNMMQRAPIPSNSFAKRLDLTIQVDAIYTSQGQDSPRQLSKLIPYHDVHTVLAYASKATIHVANLCLDVGGRQNSCQERLLQRLLAELHVRSLFWLQLLPRLVQPSHFLVASHRFLRHPSSAFCDAV